ncbi:hypothetical protein PUR71_28945 [Streptomyces sp. SP17BM10]|uniref:hypothetical protein n=1 Tax=Streptomyces sp. SP17BM10 TaxID=3002530 RepID=UPI002E78D938|nr:hypothetical protein [Streptomyces sp. SP17BM10]MEE1786902.1 hypothetical protein [Streptomyces sp. SP17BM10]
MVRFALEDGVSLPDALESLAASECENAGLDASAYAVLVQAQAAHVIANWTIDPSSIGPLDLDLLFGLEEFDQLPAKVKSALLEQYTEDSSQWEDYASGADSSLYLDRYADLQR